MLLVSIVTLLLLLLLVVLLVVVVFLLRYSYYHHYSHYFYIGLLTSFDAGYIHQGCWVGGQEENIVIIIIIIMCPDKAITKNRITSLVHLIVRACLPEKKHQKRNIP